MGLGTVFGISLVTLATWGVAWAVTLAVGYLIVRRISRRLPKPSKPPSRSLSKPAAVPLQAPQSISLMLPFFAYSKTQGWTVARLRIKGEGRGGGAQVFYLVLHLIGRKEACPGGIPRIPGSPFEKVENGKFYYGPFRSEREGIAKMRPYMLKASVETLYHAVVESGLWFPVLRERLGTATEKSDLASAMAIGSWLDILGTKISNSPGSVGAKEALSELRRHLVAYGKRQQKLIRSNTNAAVLPPTERMQPVRAGGSSSS